MILAALLAGPMGVGATALAAAVPVAMGASPVAEEAHDGLWSALKNRLHRSLGRLWTVAGLLGRHLRREREGKQFIMDLKKLRDTWS